MKKQKIWFTLDNNKPTTKDFINLHHDLLANGFNETFFDKGILLTVDQYDHLHIELMKISHLGLTSRDIVKQLCSFNVQILNQDIRNEKPKT